jgi:hypothetical protein
MGDHQLRIKDYSLLLRMTPEQAGHAEVKDL